MGFGGIPNCIQAIRPHSASGLPQLNSQLKPADVLYEMCSAFL